MAKLSQKAIQERIANKELKIKLLTKARKKIKVNFASGICCALEDSITGSYSGNSQWKAVDDLTSYISKALGYHSYYPSWLRANCEDAQKQYEFNYVKYLVKVKKSRQAWIDWMIKCLAEDIDTLKAKLK